ncbi:hypothetical protein JTY60_01855 [symbiont of Argiope bruennichi]|uniref:DNA gyrase subunit A n=1 Tax=symbiont of Argiope bruennichi TaxID=2810479 RepID=UPI003DA54307
MKNKILAQVDNIIEKKFQYLISDYYKEYAKYIIQNRAIPSFIDGFKPVQRRIIYSMYKLNLKSTSSYKKCAKVVGEVISKYHPHGDTSIYDALIRLSQPWKQRYLLVSVQGNNGSIDGDVAAAMRYTETRLTPLADDVLSYFDKSVNPFVNNFDDSEKEPLFIYSIYPILFLNGCSGIATGYASEIPSHNIKELFEAIIYYFNNPDCELNDVLEIFQGPDFPTGGIIINKNDIPTIYKNGFGKFIIEAKTEWEIVNNKFVLKILEIPYSLLKQNIVKEIEDARVKYNLEIKEILDLSDKNGLLIEVHLNTLNSKEAKEIRNILFQYTSLRYNYNCNFLAIYKKKPILFNFLRFLNCYTNFQKEFFFQVLSKKQEKLNEKLEIYSGLEKMISILDEVIAVIKKSKNKQDVILNLQKHFKFTENQASAIALMQLYRLSNTDILELKAEKKKIKNELKEISFYLSSQENLVSYIIKNIRKILEKYENEQRRTVILNIEPPIVQNIKIKKESLNLNDNEHFFLLTKFFYYQKITKKNESELLEFPINLSEKDELIALGNFKNNHIFVAVLNTGELFYFYFQNLNQTKNDGLNNLQNYLKNVNENLKIITLIQLLEFKDLNLVLFSKNSFCKKVIIKKENFEKLKTFKFLKIIKLELDDYLINCCIDKNLNFLVFKDFDNQLIIFSEKIKEMSLISKGIKLIKNDIINFSYPFVSLNDKLLLLFENKKLKKFLINELGTYKSIKKFKPFSKKLNLRRKIKYLFPLMNELLLIKNNNSYQLKKEWNYEVLKKILLDDASNNLKFYFLSFFSF